MVHMADDEVLDDILHRPRKRVVREARQVASARVQNLDTSTSQLVGMESRALLQHAYSGLAPAHLPAPRFGPTHEGELQRADARNPSVALSNRKPLLEMAESSPRSN